jgi:HAD superfamily hydrolase (TIGR01484 family)
MRFLALASDYDGTLAHHGVVTPATLEAIRRLKASGRKFILVTGRVLPELREVFPECDLCDLIVAENGALLYEPHTRTETLLAQAPPKKFAEELRARGAKPLAEGRVIVATWKPHEMVVFQTIRDLGLELQVIFNKGAVMILPSGINKATGLLAALKVLGLSSHNAVGVGDAENDHALLRLCEAGVAVRNALASLKEDADLVTAGDHGHGVEELIDHLLRDDLAALGARMERHDLAIGRQENGATVRLPAYGSNVLIAGSSGGGKSTLATTVIEKLIEARRQFCIVDPEGDYDELPHAAILGTAKRPPEPAEVMTALQKPGQNCVVNLLGISLAERPVYFEKLFSHLLQLRARTGRPHWIILDETHHILPSARADQAATTTARHCGLLMITVEPEHIARPMLEQIDLLLAIGREPGRTIGAFSQVVGEAAPELPGTPLEHGEVVAWWRHPRRGPFLFHSFPPTLPRLRHSRKYAEGDTRENSFIFRGPDGRLNLRAQNLQLFLQMGDGVDDVTWNFHLHRGDFENWFRTVIKDADLADFTAGLTRNACLSAQETRQALHQKIGERYTLPA